jgi:hypothetical protein
MDMRYAINIQNTDPTYFIDWCCDLVVSRLHRHFIRRLTFNN